MARSRIGRWARRLAAILALGIAGGVLLALALAGSSLLAVRRGGALARTSAGPVEYAERGRGPAVLFVHGAPGGYDQLLPLAEEVAAAGFRAVTFSRPGYLRTPLEGAESFERQADLAVSLLDALRTDRASVVAVSGGGPVGLQLALRHPARVERLAMVAAVTFELPGTGTQATRPFTLREDLFFLAASRSTALALDAVGVADPAMRRALRGDPGLERRLSLLFRSLAFSGLRNPGYRNDFVQAGEHNPALYPLPEIDVPVLGLYGGRDATVPVAHGERLRREIRGARLEILPEGVHAFFVLDERWVLDRLLPFLAGR